ncbi:hypothetical protein OAR19_00565, partial [bacterium]|nr:hypothetical protein [bacterium]
MSAKEIIFTVNGPGELRGIIFPLIKVFKERLVNIVYTLYIVPCQFGSGLEESLAQKSGLFDHVFSIVDYKKVWLKKQLPQEYQQLKEGIVFYAGGDGYHAINLAKKYKFPAYA